MINKFLISLSLLISVSFAEAKQVAMAEGGGASGIFKDEDKFVGYCERTQPHFMEGFRAMAPIFINSNYKCLNKDRVASNLIGIHQFVLMGGTNEDRIVRYEQYLPGVASSSFCEGYFHAKLCAQNFPQTANGYNAEKILGVFQSVGNSLADDKTSTAIDKAGAAHIELSHPDHRCLNTYLCEKRSLFE